MSILESSADTTCKSEGCNWLGLALQTLINNNINVTHFAKAIENCLQLGRGKGRNVMIAGPANCGKTFLLAPLTKIYNAFVNPACGTFAWVGIEDAEIIYLNDFRWNERVIPWHDLLRLLEGDSVHFPAPKTHYAKDILLQKDTPIFCTSIGPIVRSQNQGETEMMQIRWNMFKFFYQIASNNAIDIPPCETCFSKFILTYSK